MDLRSTLIRKIQAQGSPASGARPPVVSLEDFFVGNLDHGSIGCNLRNSPGPEAFFGALRSIRGNESVQDVLVEVNEVIEGDTENGPFQTGFTF
ncbi:MAG: hypothetical protein ABSB35_38005 [Bryobacteraceae bacterium]|jgi:hypothetical protein